MKKSRMDRTIVDSWRNNGPCVLGNNDQELMDQQWMLIFNYHPLLGTPGTSDLSVLNINHVFVEAKPSGARL